MKLSIITINLNNAPGLRKTIESVVSQTSRDFEYIIIDGGSTDGSVELIQSFTSIPPGVYIAQDDDKEKTPSSSLFRTFAPSLPHSLAPSPHAPCPIVYWLSEPDTGIYQAMNKGIRVARGEYCQFLNSGDWLVASDVIEKMLATLPDCSIYYGNMLKQMPKGKIYRDTCQQGKLTMLDFYSGSLNHSPVCIKRSLFDKYGLYDETLRIASDWKWYLIVIGLNNESVKYENFDVTCFDMNGISNTNHDLLEKERRKVLEELLPARILSDYDTHSHNIDQLDRINRHKVSRWIFWLTDRILFKLEKVRHPR